MKLVIAISSPVMTKKSVNSIKRILIGKEKIHTEIMLLMTIYKTQIIQI